MKTIKLLALLLFIFSNNLYAQEKEAKKKRAFNINKNEIGIDIQNLFKGGTLGTSLVYKKRVGEKTYSPLNKKKTLRFEIGGNGEIPLTDTSDYDLDTLGTSNVSNLLRKSIIVYSYVGFEWQFQRNRVQYFYGFKTRLSYSKINYLSATISSSLLGGSYLINTEKEISIPLVGFGGVKYFFTPEFSLSLESSLSIDFSIEKTDRSQQGNGTISFEFEGITRRAINYNIDFLNALNFSYYF